MELLNTVPLWRRDENQLKTRGPGRLKKPAASIFRKYHVFSALIEAPRDYFRRSRGGFWPSKIDAPLKKKRKVTLPERLELRRFTKTSSKPQGATPLTAPSVFLILGVERH